MKLRWIALATLVAFTSCTTWHEKHPPVDYTPTHPEDVRLTLSDTTVTMRASGVRGDSLVGVRKGSDSIVDGSSRIAVALSQVRKLEVREFDGFKTAALIGSIALLGVIIIAAIGAAGSASLIG